MKLIHTMKRFMTGYFLAILLGLAATAALAVTTRMNQMAGIAQGASEEGQFLLGWGAIIVHVAGVVLCGLMLGSAAKRGYRKLAGGMGGIVIASAIFSMMSIMGFMEIEALSVNQSRAAKIEQRAKDAEARRQAADTRLKLQAELAKEQLKYNQIETKGRLGRAERKELRRDMQEASRNLIADVGKDGAAPKESTDEPMLMAPASGSVLISKLTFGLLQPTDAQSFKLGYMTVLLLVLEVVLWPTAGYAWGGFAPHAPASTAMPDTLPPSPAPTKIEVSKPLTLPKPVQAMAPPTRAAPEPEWRALLDMVDFPKKKLMGTRRPRDKREVLGLRFMIYLCSHGIVGDFTADQLDKIYEEYATADNREEWATRIVKAELRDIKKWVTVRDSRSPTMWTIASPPLAQLKQLLAKRKIIVTAAPEVAPEQQEAGGGADTPFGFPASGAPSAPQLAANENQVAASRKALQGLGELSRHLPDLEGMRRLERMQKALWQQRLWAVDRKQRNRMSRVRSAA